MAPPRLMWVALTVFLFSCVATGSIRRLALTHGLTDVPNSRSSHTAPTPRGGGLAIVAAFFLALAMLSPFGILEAEFVRALAIGGGATALVGFLDDRRPQPASLRFGVHVGAAIYVLSAIGGITEQALAHWGLQGAWIAALFSVVTLVWMTNLFNFMDGIDGIAASQSAFVSAAGAWIFWSNGGGIGLASVMACLAAASLGFLCWNWPPARIFMGDVGSGFLGFSLAVFAIATSKSGVMPIEAWAILAGIFEVDATLTLLRRALRGDRWFEAHRTHAYQRMARRFRGHRPVTLSVLLIDIGWLLPWAILATQYPDRARWMVVGALAPIVVLALCIGAGAEEG